MAAWRSYQGKLVTVERVDRVRRRMVRVVVLARNAKAAVSVARAPAAKRRGRGETDEQVLAVVRLHPWLRVGGIARELRDLTYGCVSVCLTRLVQRGLLERSLGDRKRGACYSVAS